MGIKLNSPAGGSVEINVDSGVTGAYQMKLPANGSGTILTTSAQYGSMKNRIINGDFRIDQRFAGAANNNIALNQYVIDRWRNNGSAAAKLRYQQNNINGPGSAATLLATGFPNYFGANVVSSNTVNAGDFWFTAQSIEGYNTADFNWGTAAATPVTLSFWVYSSVAGTHSGSIRNYDANRTYPFTYSISAANNWQYQTITIPGDTSGTWLSNNNIGVDVFFSLGIGTNYTSSTTGSWQAGNYIGVTDAVKVVNNANGSFYLTGVQLEKGSANTSFDWRHYQTEFALCQRYYETSVNNSMLRLVGYSAGAGESWVGPSAVYKVSKRDSTAPVITFSYTNASSGSVSGYNSEGFSVQWAAIGGTGQHGVFITYTISAEMNIQN